MRKPVIAGNWKMYKTIQEAIDLSKGLKAELAGVERRFMDIIICPPFTALSMTSEVISGSNIMLGAQDIYWQEEGAFTGEVSPAMLLDSGCSHVIIGHSERRQFFAETNQTVNKKIFAALKEGLVPIVCIGETLKEREAGDTFKVLETQLKEGLAGLSQEQARGMIVAYEPVWAIGTGKTATSQIAQEAHKHIRKVLTELFAEQTSGDMRIQYGGSVKPENISELMSQPDIDGALVGGASLKVDTFTAIVKNATKVRK